MFRSRSLRKSLTRLYALLYGSCGRDAVGPPFDPWCAAGMMIVSGFFKRQNVGILPCNVGIRNDALVSMEKHTWIQCKSNKVHLIGEELLVAFVINGSDCASKRNWDASDIWPFR